MSDELDDYQSRYRQIRAGLFDLSGLRVLPDHVVDQVDAAIADTGRTLANLREAEPDDDRPSTFATERSFGSEDLARVLDVQARFIAAMHDDRWERCEHLERAPAQPFQIHLAARRVVCNRCAGSVVTPAAEEPDRCGLCGSTGNPLLWPVRVAVLNALVIGELCADCLVEVTGSEGQR